MEAEFTIDVALYLKDRKLSYGKFILGADKNFALNIFNQFKGSRDPLSHYCLQIELLQNVAGLPVPIDVLRCSLPDLNENISLLSKEIFRIAQLEDGNSPLG